jgi:pentatricopeptide repeat protein
MRLDLSWASRRLRHFWPRFWNPPVVASPPVSSPIPTRKHEDSLLQKCLISATTTDETLKWSEITKVRFPAAGGASRLRLRRDSPLPNAIPLHTPQDLYNAWNELKAMDQAARRSIAEVARGTPLAAKVTRIVLDILTSWAEDETSTLPEPLQVIKTIRSDFSHDMAVLFIEPAIWALVTHQLIRGRRSARIEHQVVQIWLFIIQTFGRGPQAVPIYPSSPEWPDTERDTIWKFGQGGGGARRSHTWETRIESVFPSFPPALRKSLYRAAVTTFSIYSLRGKKALKGELGNLMGFLSMLLYRTLLNGSGFQTYVRETSIPTYAKKLILKAVWCLGDHTWIFLTATRACQSHYERANHLTFDKHMKEMESLILYKLRGMESRGAYGKFRDHWTRSVRRLLALREFWFSTRDTESPTAPLFTLDMYRRFLMAAQSMHNHGLAISIFSHMMQKYRGNITIKEWTSLLPTVSTTYDAKAGEEYWDTIVSSVAHIDDILITARIQAVLKEGRSEKALEMLNSVSAKWLAAAAAYCNKGTGRPKNLRELRDLPGAPKPNTVTLNMAMSGLRKHQPWRVPELLKWAASLGIAGDTYTFNIVASMHADQGQYGLAVGTLGEMVRQGLEPDHVTFGLLVRCDIQRRDTPMQEKVAAVFKLIKGMEARGIAADESIFVWLIAQSRSGKVGMESATSAVSLATELGKEFRWKLLAMVNKQLIRESGDVSKHVTPFLEACKAENAELLDSWTCNTLMEVCAQHGELQHMDVFRSYLHRHKRVPTWKGLLAVLGADVVAGRVEDAKEVIKHATEAVSQGVMCTHGPDDSDMAEWFREQFWALARHHSLVDAPPP